MRNLLWKEWRENRLLLGVGILFLCAFRLFPFLTDFKVIEVVSLFMFLTCSIFSVLLGATGFSQEIDRNTLSFIASKPVSRSMLWIAKVVSNLFLIGILFVVAILLSIGYLKDINVLLEDIKFWLGNHSLLWVFSLAFLSYVFSFLISTIIHRPLISAGIGILVASVISILIFLFSILLIRGYNLEVLMFKVILINFIISLIFLFYSLLLWRNYISRFKSARKPVTISLGSIFLIIGVVYGWSYYSSVKELQKVYRQIEVSGDSLTLESVVPPIILEAENAAIIYQKAFESMKFTAEKESILRKLFQNKIEWSEELISPMKKLVERNKEALGYIREATLYDKCRFPIEYEKGSALLLPHLSKMRKCGQLLCIQALLQSEEGDVKGAINTCRLALRMGKHIFSEPLLISQLVRIAIHSVTIKSLEIIINQHPDYYDGYLELLKELDGYEGHDAFVRCLKGERNIFGIYVFKYMTYEPVKQPLYIRLFAYLLRPLLNKDFAFYLQVQNDIINASEYPYYEVIERIQNFDNIKMVPLYGNITRNLLPALSSSMARQAQSEAQLRTCKLGLALKVYKSIKGIYPESLRDLIPDILTELPVDPFTGKGFHYNREGDGFIVYSIGKNLKDDNGVAKRKSNKDDISWRCENITCNPHKNMVIFKIVKTIKCYYRGGRYE